MLQALRARGRHAVRLGAALLALAIAMAPGPVAEAAGSTPANRPGVATFGTQTATATRPDSRTYFNFAATPGGQLTDYLAVINYSAQPLVLSIKGVDAVNTPQGGFAARPVNQAPRDIGGWIEVRASDLQVALPPRTDRIIPFLISVPRSASPGDHVGAITATLQSSVISKSGQRVKLLQTTGTRIFLRVSGPLHPQLSIENLKVDYQGTANPIGRGRARLTYTVANTGNLALGGRQKISVSGLFGSNKTATNVRDVQLLLPGFSVRETVVVTGVLPEIHDTGRVSITPLVIPGSAQPPSGPFLATVSFWAVPWTLVAIVVAVILLIVLAVLLRRRRRRRGGGKAPSGPEGGAPAGKEFRPDVTSSERESAAPPGRPVPAGSEPK